MKTNKELLELYPWLGTSDEDGDFTWLDCIPEGWREAFGEQMCAEIQDIIDRDNIIDYEVLQVKEKFAALRWYDAPYNEDIHKIIRKYAYISARTCIGCGTPAKWISTGWYCPYCDECRESDSYFIPIEEFYGE